MSKVFTSGNFRKSDSRDTYKQQTSTLRLTPRYSQRLLVDLLNLFHSNYFYFIQHGQG
jgi:hypothetical protein